MHVNYRSNARPRERQFHGEMLHTYNGYRIVDTAENKPPKVSVRWGVPNRICTRHARGVFASDEGSGATVGLTFVVKPFISRGNESSDFRGSLGALAKH